LGMVGFDVIVCRGGAVAPPCHPISTD
jgi:hypothetical protein